MISRDSLRATGLTVAIGSLVGTFLWWDATTIRQAQNFDPVLQQSAPQIEQPAIAPRSMDRFSVQRAPQAPAGGVYRCEQGGTITYQAEPCARGSVQSDVSRGSVSVFDGRAQTDQLARLQALRQPPDPRQETAFGEIAAPPPVIGSARCQALIEAIERVDEQGRRPNKSQTLEWLRKTRRELVDEMYMLKCSRIPQR